MICWGWWVTDQYGVNLAGDEVLADGQSHLDGIGPVDDRGGIELDLPGAMPLVGLVDSIPEEHFMFFGAQDRPDVHDFGVTSSPGKREQEEHCQQEQAHPVHGLGTPRLSQRPAFGGLPSSRQGETVMPETEAYVGGWGEGGGWAGGGGGGSTINDLR